MDERLIMLKQIADQLDQNIFPDVLNSGIVTPSESSIPLSPWAEEEEHHERQRKTGPETRSGAGATTGQRAADRDRSASPSSPVISTSVQTRYEKELAAVVQAYPKTRVWRQPEGLWLLTESALLPRLWQKAVFLTGIPFDPRRIVRSWGFWSGIPMQGYTWIGPRHTNCPDGSICAFEPADGTWQAGGSIVQLLDIYTVWALRHLCLQVFGRWPGDQVGYFAYERLTEFNISEYCGCGSGILYGDCCREKDLKADYILEALKFFGEGFGVRQIPEQINNFVRRQDNPPEISQFLPRTQMVSHDGTVKAIIPQSDAAFQFAI